MLVKVKNSGQIANDRETGRTSAQREEGDEVMEEKMKAFVVLMLNELENAIELLRLWKSLWGHRKLAPVWELACWQKRGFVWGNFLHRLAAAETLTAVTRLRLFCRHSLARPFFKNPVSFFCSPFSFISRRPGRSPRPRVFTRTCWLHWDSREKGADTRF